jgi:hypothetical protein
MALISIHLISLRMTVASQSPSNIHCWSIVLQLLPILAQSTARWMLKDLTQHLEDHGHCQDGNLLWRQHIHAVHYN